MGEAGGCQAARGLCSGRNAGPRGRVPWLRALYGAHPSRPLCRGEAQTRPAFWGDCPPHPAQHMPPCTGAEERGAVVRPEPAAGRAVWGEHTGRS